MTPGSTPASVVPVGETRPVSDRGRARGRQRGTPLWRHFIARVARVSVDPRRRRLFRVLTPVRVAWAYFCDARRFVRAAHLAGPFKNRLTAKAHLLRTAHALEKGQAIPEPRLGFGAEKITALLADTSRYQQTFGCDDVSFAVVGILRGIQTFHARTGHARDEWEHALRGLEAAESNAGRSDRNEIGPVPLTRAAVLAALPTDPEAFFRLRFSVRQFAPEPIDRAVLEQAVSLAQKAPSVCNRQSGRVRIYTDPAEMRIVLKHQDGNAGFGHQATAVMVVTADLSCFYSEAERNQGFVDGGMFAVSLVYTLHSLGLGSCLLNWSRGPYDDRELRRELGLPDHEVVITLLAAGHLRPTFPVAASPRRPLSDVLTWGQLRRSETNT